MGMTIQTPKKINKISKKVGSCLQLEFSKWNNLALKEEWKCRKVNARFSVWLHAGDVLYGFQNPDSQWSMEAKPSSPILPSNSHPVLISFIFLYPTPIHPSKHFPLRLLPRLLKSPAYLHNCSCTGLIQPASNSVLDFVMIPLAFAGEKSTQLHLRNETFDQRVAFNVFTLDRSAQTLGGCVKVCRASDFFFF